MDSLITLFWSIINGGIGFLETGGILELEVLGLAGLMGVLSVIGLTVVVG